jgi:hypothetical protein
MSHTEICLQVTDNLFDELRVWQRYKPDDESYIDQEWFKWILAQKLPMDTGVFPFDLRWVSPNGTGAIMEVPPGPRIITFTNADQFASGVGDKPVHQIQVWAPRTVIGVVLSNSWSPVTVWTYVVPKPIEGRQDLLYQLPLPNLYSDSRVCLPSTERNFEQSTFAHGLFAAYETVWDTRYNTDLLDLLKMVGSTHQPSAIWNEMQKTYDLRRKTLEEKGVGKRHRFRGQPSATPFQVLQAWGRLSPEEVEGIEDWHHGGETVHHLISTISKFTTNDPTAHSLFQAIRESVGL